VNLDLQKKQRGGKKMFKFKTIAYIAISVMMPLFLLASNIAAGSDINGIQIFEKEKRIEVKGEISTELERYADTLGGAMEYLAVSKGGKEYESLIVLECKPDAIYNALIKFGLEKGKPAKPNEKGKPILPTGDPVRLFVEWKDEEGKTKRIRAEDLIYSTKTKKRMQYVHWPFIGSDIGYFDPESDEEVLMANVTKNVISLHHGDGSVILQNPLKEAAAEEVPYRLFSKVLQERIQQKKSQAQIEKLKKKLASLPKAGTKVKLIIDANNPLMQIRALISGKVQGVGFRDFTMRNARRIGGIKGYVKNLEDGRVELVAEGHKFDLDILVRRIERGPRAAKVEKVEKEERSFSGKYKQFEIVR